MRTPKPRPFFDAFPDRALFEAAARKALPSLKVDRHGRAHGAEIVYTVQVDVPHFEPRRIKVRFANLSEPFLIGVTADGSTASPHRYPGSGHLCMWHPDAGDHARWTPDEGLWTLTQYVRVHLFREAYWRQTGGYEGGVWAGDEVRHGETKSEEAGQEAA